MSTRAGFPALARRAGVLALLGLSFLWGFFIEVSDLFDDIEFWPGAVALVFPWIVVLTIALAALMGRDAHLYSASWFGVILGAQAVPLFLVGALSPFALGLGDRSLTELGGEFGWALVLIWLLVVWGLGGAVLGAVLGAVGDAPFQESIAPQVHLGAAVESVARHLLPLP